MFDKLIREIKRFESGVRIQIDMPIDDDGYFDRRCHAPSCLSDFKVLFVDWRDKVRDEQVFCPICRHEDAGTEWSTPAQDEYIRQVGIAHVQSVINKGLVDSAREFNRQQKPGFINISMSVKPGTRMIVLPIQAVAEMRQKYTCTKCGCRYSVIGSAYFCPSCGENSTIETFTRTIESIRDQALKIDGLREIITANFDKDTAENSVRSLLEGSLEKILALFQHFAEALFVQVPTTTATKRRKNVFQNLSESSGLWRTAIGIGYADLIGATALAEIEELFQKRHLLAHRNGIVDQEYIDKSGDTTYAVGQRLVIKSTDVIRFTKLVDELAQSLQKAIQP